MKLSRLSNSQLRRLLRKGDVRFATPKYGYTLIKAIRDFVGTASNSVLRNPKLLEVERLAKELEERDPEMAKKLNRYIKHVKSGIHYDIWNRFYDFISPGEFDHFKWLD